MGKMIEISAAEYERLQDCIREDGMRIAALIEENKALHQDAKRLTAVDAAPVEYPVILVREGNGAYSALIPDFGCATCGESEAEARQKATECIAGRMLLMRDDNETFPEPSKMTNGLLHCCCVDADANPDNAFWVLCPVKMEGKTK